MTSLEGSDDEYLDDPIQLIDFEQKRISTYQEEKNNGQCYDQADSDGELFIESDKNLKQKKAPKYFGGRTAITLPVRFFDIPQNVKYLNNCRSLSISIVDCNKYPWYYKKYLKPSTDDIRKENLNNNSEMMKIRPVATPYKVLIDQKDKSNNIENQETQNKSQNNLKDWQKIIKQKALEQRNSLQIDFKKNLGLIGMKISHTNEKLPRHKRKKDTENQKKVKDTAVKGQEMQNDSELTKQKINILKKNKEEVVKNDGTKEKRKNSEKCNIDVKKSQTVSSESNKFLNNNMNIAKLTHISASQDHTNVKNHKELSLYQNIEEDKFLSQKQCQNKIVPTVEGTKSKEFITEQKKMPDLKIENTIAHNKIKLDELVKTVIIAKKTKNVEELNSERNKSKYEISNMPTSKSDKKNTKTTKKVGKLPKLPNQVDAIKNVKMSSEESIMQCMIGQKIKNVVSTEKNKTTKALFETKSNTIVSSQPFQNNDTLKTSQNKSNVCVQGPLKKQTNTSSGSALNLNNPDNQGALPLSTSVIQKSTAPNAKPKELQKKCILKAPVNNNLKYSLCVEQAELQTPRTNTTSAPIWIPPSVSSINSKTTLVPQNPSEHKANPKNACINVTTTTMSLSSPATTQASYANSEVKIPVTGDLTLHQQLPPGPRVLAFRRNSIPAIIAKSVPKSDALMHSQSLLISNKNTNTGKMQLHICKPINSSDFYLGNNSNNQNQRQSDTGNIRKIPTILNKGCNTFKSMPTMPSLPESKQSSANSHSDIQNSQMLSHFNSAMQKLNQQRNNRPRMLPPNSNIQKTQAMCNMKPPIIINKTLKNVAPITDPFGKHQKLWIADSGQQAIQRQLPPTCDVAPAHSTNSNVHHQVHGIMRPNLSEPPPNINVQRHNNFENSQSQPTTFVPPNHQAMFANFPMQNEKIQPFMREQMGVGFHNLPPPQYCQPKIIHELQKNAPNTNVPRQGNINMQYNGCNQVQPNMTGPEVYGLSSTQLNAPLQSNQLPVQKPIPANIAGPEMSQNYRMGTPQNLPNEYFGYPQQFQHNNIPFLPNYHNVPQNMSALNQPNYYPRYWNTMPPPPPPLPSPSYPPPHLQSAVNASMATNQTASNNQSSHLVPTSVAGNTIIGCNNNGPVRKICINTGIPASNDIKKTLEINTQQKATESTAESNVCKANDVTHIYNKKDMLEELARSAACISPPNNAQLNVAKTDSEKPWRYEINSETEKNSGQKVILPPQKNIQGGVVNVNPIQETSQLPKENNAIKEFHQSVNQNSSHKESLKRKPSVNSQSESLRNDEDRYKPGPLSKKAKPDSLVNIQNEPHKGYSPPILPIPSYTKTLEILAKSGLCESQAMKKIDFNDETECDAHKGKSELDIKDNAKEKDVKKISLDEYKKRTLKSDEKTNESENLEGFQVDKIKIEIKSETPEQADPEQL